MRVPKPGCGPVPGGIGGPESGSDGAADAQSGGAAEPERARTPEPGGAGDAGRAIESFEDVCARLFEAHFHRVYRVLDRLSGEPELAADLAQEAFVKLYRRGSAPERPEAWLVTVAMNLFRNEKASRTRRRRLLTLARGEAAHSDPPASGARAAEAEEARRRARAAMGRLPERDRSLLLLHYEGYSYRDIAAALDLNEASVGTLLARARRAFREAYEEAFHAP